MLKMKVSLRLTQSDLSDQQVYSENNRLGTYLLYFRMSIHMGLVGESIFFPVSGLQLKI